MGTAEPEQPEGDLRADLIDHPPEVHAEEPGDERERHEDRGDHAHHVRPLVQLQVQQHGHRVRRRVDRGQQAVELPVEAVEVGLLVGIEAAERPDLHADSLEDGLLAADPAPHRREPPRAITHGRPRHARAAVVAPPFRNLIQRQLDLLQRAERGREHPVEHRVDDVAPAPLLRQLETENRRQRDVFLMKRQQILAGDEDLDAEGL